MSLIKVQVKCMTGKYNAQVRTRVGKISVSLPLKAFKDLF